MRNIGSLIWPACRSALRVGWHMPRTIASKIIALYQTTLSPDHGPLRHIHPYGFCRHEPTCSEYGKSIIKTRGVIVGSVLILKRLSSCHPWKKLSEEKVMKIASQRASN